jgi:hypothetical protein
MKIHLNGILPLTLRSPTKTTYAYLIPMRAARPRHRMPLDLITSMTQNELLQFLSLSLLRPDILLSIRPTCPQSMLLRLSDRSGFIPVYTYK